jgi:hypothetical protein
MFEKKSSNKAQPEDKKYESFFRATSSTAHMIDMGMMVPKPAKFNESDENPSWTIFMVKEDIGSLITQEDISYLISQKCLVRLSHAEMDENNPSTLFCKEIALHPGARALLLKHPQIKTVSIVVGKTGDGEMIVLNQNLSELNITQMDNNEHDVAELFIKDRFMKQPNESKCLIL